MKSVGIDIGSYSIKVAEVNISRKSAVVTDFKEYPLSTQPNADQSLEIIETLRNISTNYDSTQTRFVFGIAQNDVSLRRKLFPFRERQKILKSLAFELEDEIPFDLDDTTFEAKILELQGTSSIVMACACPNESILAHLERAKEGHIDPAILSVDSFALSNLFEEWSQSPPETSAATDPEKTQIDAKKRGRLILMMGHHRSLLLAYNQDSLVSIRSVLWGASEIAKNISRAFNIPLAESLKVVQLRCYILMNSAGANKDQILLSETVKESLVDLSRELKFSVIELQTENNLYFPQLEILGGASNLQNMGPYLTQTLEMPVNQIKPFDRIGFSFEVTPAIEAAAPVAVGLAIEGLKTARNPALNLRRGLYAKQNQSFNLFWEKWKSAVQIGGAALIIVFIHSILREGYSTALSDSIEDALTKQAKTVGRTSSNLEKYLTEQKNLIKGRESLAKLDRYSSALDVLTKLTQKLPQNQKEAGINVAIEVGKLSIDNEDLLIEGSISSPGQIGLIENALKQIASGEIKKVTATGTNQKMGTPFAYRMKIHRIESQ